MGIRQKNKDLEMATDRYTGGKGELTRHTRIMTFFLENKIEIKVKLINL